jgi:hypothetical protein
MSTKPAVVLAVVRFATVIAEAGKHVDMAQTTAGISKRRFIGLSTSRRDNVIMLLENGPDPSWKGQVRPDWHAGGW